MKKLAICLSLLTLMVFFLFTSTSFAQQDPGDGYLPDSVMFEGIDYYLGGPPYEGKLKVPVVFLHDVGLVGIITPFVWSGPVVADSASFAGSRVEQAVYKAIEIDSLNSKILLAVVSALDTIPSGCGLLGTIYFSIMDTGYLHIDTAFFPPAAVLAFSGVYAQAWVPQFADLQLHLMPTETGDANQDGYVGIADAVFVVNYLFRNGSAPSCSNCADVNCDCEITISDVVFLINYLFRGGDPPQFGCVSIF